MTEEQKNKALAEDVFRAREYLAQICKGLIPSMHIPVDENDFDCVFKRLIDHAAPAQPSDDAKARALEFIENYGADTQAPFKEIWPREYQTIKAALQQPAPVVDVEALKREVIAELGKRGTTHWHVIAKEAIDYLSTRYEFIPK